MLKKIIIIIIAGVFIGIAGIYLIAPTQTKSKKITYSNEIYGYSLRIPKEWKNKYEISEEKNTTSFLYTAVPETKEPIFSIISYSQKEWEEIEKEKKETEEKGLAPGCCLQLLADINGTIFVYNLSIGNPYEIYGKKIADEYSKMVGQAPEIITSFSVSK